MKLKKAMLAFVCALALVVGSVMGTMAYLTSEDTVTNTFTVGNVVITLDEAPTNLNGEVTSDKDEDRVQANEYKLMPGHEYAKDPTVWVDADSEDAYLFVEVVNGIEEIEAEGNTTIAKQMEDNGWIHVTGNVYVYDEKVSAGAEIPVFANFTIDGDVDNDTLADYATEKGEDGEVLENATKLINITAYAIQADGFEDDFDAGNYTTIWGALND